MADLKISQLSDGGNSQATDEYVIARSGANYRIDGASIAAAATSVGTLSSLTVSGATALQSQTTMSRQAGAAVNLLLGLRSGVADIATDTAGTIRFLNAAQSTVNLALTDAGNLGLGVTPSASWESSSNSRFMQIGRSGAFGYSAANAQTAIYGNAYQSALNTYAYISTAYAGMYSFSDFSGAHAWYTAASGTAGNAITFTQAMTLDASGNLVIGGTTALSGGGNAKWLTVNAVSGSTYSGGIAYSINGTAKAYHYVDVDFLSHQAQSGVGHKFIANGTEAARITSGGNLLVGTTAAAAGERLHVKSAGNTAATYNCFFANSDAALVFNFEDAGKFRTGTLADSPYNYVVGGTNRDLFVDSSGYIGYVSSVRASKTNIAPVIDTDWLLALNPVTFNFRKKDEDGQYTDEADGPIKHGLIAEEVEAVNADLCFYDDAASGGALRGVNYTHLITPMLKLIQTQQSRIEALEARLEALEA